MATHRVVVVTGASSGIGAALARVLGQRGDAVVLAARRADMLEAVAKESGREALCVPADVTRRADVERLRDDAIARFGHVEVWVNNAGRGVNRPTIELTDADFDEMMTVNVKSALYGMQAIAPHFLSRGRGHIINVSSFLGRVPVATHRSAYNAAKAALNALTANARVDLKRQNANIHVSLVMPGIVRTEFVKSVLYSEGAGLMPWTRDANAPPPLVQTAEDVAAMIAGVIDNPVAELYTNPASAGMARKYFEDVGAFETGRG